MDDNSDDNIDNIGEKKTTGLTAIFNKVANHPVGQVLNAVGSVVVPVVAAVTVTALALATSVAVVPPIIRAVKPVTPPTPAASTPTNIRVATVNSSNAPSASSNPALAPTGNDFNQIGIRNPEGTRTTLLYNDRHLRNEAIGRLQKAGNSMAATHSGIGALQNCPIDTKIHFNAQHDPSNNPRTYIDGSKILIYPDADDGTIIRSIAHGCSYQQYSKALGAPKNPPSGFNPLTAMANTAAFVNSAAVTLELLANPKLDDALRQQLSSKNFFTQAPEIKRSAQPASDTSDLQVITINDSQGQYLTSLVYDAQDDKEESISRIKKAAEYLALTETGREVLKACEAQNMEFHFNKEENVKNGSSGFVQGQDLSLNPETKDAELISLIAHECRHAQQKMLLAGLMPAESRLNPGQNILRSWLIEADAMAVEVSVAWELSLNKTLPEHTRNKLKESVILSVPLLKDNYESHTHSDVLHITFRSFFNNGAATKPEDIARQQENAAYPGRADGHYATSMLRYTNKLINLAQENPPKFDLSTSTQTMDFERAAALLTLPSAGERVNTMPDNFVFGSQQDTPFSNHTAALLYNVYLKMTPDAPVMLPGALPESWTPSGFREDWEKRDPKSAAQLQALEENPPPSQRQEIAINTAQNIMRKALFPKSAPVLRGVNG
ncbi:MAG: DUF6782 family putative metallopeptidase [Alphaproteobacteria bacterium]